MKVVYVAHRLGRGPDRDQNRADAAAWCGWIAETFKVAISADWIVLTGVWSEDKGEMGLATDLEMVSRADEVWQVGPVLSPGMILEGEHARKLGKPVRNFVGMSRSEIGTTVFAVGADFGASGSSGFVEMVYCKSCETILGRADGAWISYHTLQGCVASLRDQVKALRRDALLRNMRW